MSYHIFSVLCQGRLVFLSRILLCRPCALHLLNRVFLLSGHATYHLRTLLDIHRIETSNWILVRWNSSVLIFNDLWISSKFQSSWNHTHRAFFQCKWPIFLLVHQYQHVILGLVVSDPWTLYFNEEILFERILILNIWIKVILFWVLKFKNLWNHIPNEVSPKFNSKFKYLSIIKTTKIIKLL